MRVFEIPDHVVLETTDDGKGDPRAIELAIGRANGYGLRSLRRTCQEMGGALSFVRHDPHGLTARVALPIGGSR